MLPLLHTRPIAAFASKKLPTKAMMIIVGTPIIVISIRIMLRPFSDPRQALEFALLKEAVRNIPQQR